MSIIHHHSLLRREEPYQDASMIYSLRKVNTNYVGSSIQVRRSVDNALQDIGFVNGGLDTSSLLSFVGSGDGFVRTWYDQGKFGRNLFSTVNTRQPQIVSNGTIITVKNKPATYFDGIDDMIGIYNVGTIFSLNNVSAFCVVKPDATSPGINRTFLAGRGVTVPNRFFILYNSGVNFEVGDPSTSDVITPLNLSQSLYVFEHFNNIAKGHFANIGSSTPNIVTNDTKAIVAFGLGNYITGVSSGANVLQGHIQETIIFVETLPDRLVTQNAINSYYGIY